MLKIINFNISAIKKKRKNMFPFLIIYQEFAFIIKQSRITLKIIISCME